MTREEKISAGLRAWWASQPRPPGLRLTRNNTPEGVCLGCGGAAAQKSMNPDAVRKRRGRSDFFDTCGTAACKVAWFRLWCRDARQEGYR